MPNRKTRVRKEPTNYSTNKMLNRYVPKTTNQIEYVRAICENQITFCTGVSGSGKTCLAFCLACEHLLENKIERIILTKPYVETGRGLGALPGELELKIAPYLATFHDYLDYFLGIEQKKKFLSEGKIKILAMEYCRGITFRGSYIIADEMQNASWEQIKMLLTRIDDYSKIIINGDYRQTDLNGRNKSGLEPIIEKLKGVNGIGFINMEKCDILRAGIIKDILGRLEE